MKSGKVSKSVMSRRPWVEREASEHEQESAGAGIFISFIQNSLLSETKEAHHGTPQTADAGCTLHPPARVLCLYCVIIRAQAVHEQMNRKSRSIIIMG